MCQCAPRPQIIESTKVERSAANVSDAAAGRFRDRRFPLLKNEAVNLITAGSGNKIPHADRSTFHRLE